VTNIKNCFIKANLRIATASGWLHARSAEGLTMRWSQPLAVAMRRLAFMKQFLMFVTLAPASGGSAHSR